MVERSNIMNENIYKAILNPVTLACVFVGGVLIGVGLAREHIRKSQIQEDE